MDKDFAKWHELKIKLQKKQSKVFFHEREIWLCSLGLNLGYEQDGKKKAFTRPVIIIRKFNFDIFWGIPLTSKEKDGKYYYSFDFGSRRSSGIISQVKLMDRKRLVRKLGIIKKKNFEELKKRITELL